MCDRIHRGQHIRRHAEFGWRDCEAVGEEIEAIHGEEKRDAFLARALVASSEAALSLGEYDAAIQSSMEAAGIHRKARHDEFEAEDWGSRRDEKGVVSEILPAVSEGV